MCHIFASIAKHKSRKIFAGFFRIFKGCEILFYTTVGKNLCGVLLNIVMNTFLNSVQIIFKKPVKNRKHPRPPRDTCSVDARNKE
jgi:hypothetical protein